jgi:hypothetical protein
MLGRLVAGERPARKRREATPPVSLREKIVSPSREYKIKFGNRRKNVAMHACVTVMAQGFAMLLTE